MAFIYYITFILNLLNNLRQIRCEMPQKLYVVYLYNYIIIHHKYYLLWKIKLSVIYIYIYIYNMKIINK